GSRQAGGGGGQWLRARRRMRNGHGLYDPRGLREREVWAARSQVGSHSGRRWNATPAPAGREGPGPAAHSVRRDDRRAGGLSHRSRERSRSGRQSDPTRRSDPETNLCQRPDRREVRTRGGEQRIGDEPGRGLVTGSRIIRAVRRDGRQKGGHAGLPAKARRTASGAGEGKRKGENPEN